MPPSPGHWSASAARRVCQRTACLLTERPCFSAGRVLVHEWAKYRWGVFEEAGYAEDPLYPSFYQRSADQWAPTGCADAAVAGIVSP